MSTVSEHTKTLFAWLAVALLISAGATYYRIMIKHDYPVVTRGETTATEVY